jgi:hypothetical protein
MIISDEHGFVFVHIPKCAGTSVRKFIDTFDSRKGMFTFRVDDHLALGKLDYAHIPLFVLREHFPHEFEALQNYWSFAVVRNPFDRFASSLSERLSGYGAKTIQHCSKKEIRSSIRQTIEYLTEEENCLLSKEFIHFQRQVDYIQLDGEQIIESIYTIDQIEELLADVESKLGRRLVNPSAHASNRHANRSIVFRNNFLRRVNETLRPKMNGLVQVLPKSIRQKIRECVYVPRDKRLRDIFEEDHVQAFIRDYYSDDITFYQRVLQTKHS